MRRGREGIDGLAGVGLVVARQIEHALQIGIIGVEISAGRPVGLRHRIASPQQFRFEHARDCIGDFVLQLEQILVGPVVMLRPHRAAVARVDQFGIDAHHVAFAPHAAFQDMGDTELRADDVACLRAVPEFERRISADDFQSPELRKCRDQIFGEAVGEIQRIGIAAFVDQRQDGYGFFGNDDSDAADGGFAAHHEFVGQQQHHRQCQHADDPEIQPAARGADGGFAGRGFALAFDALRRQFVVPGERQPERKADGGRDEEPARQPVRRAHGRSQRRDALASAHTLVA